MLRKAQLDKFPAASLALAKSETVVFEAIEIERPAPTKLDLLPVARTEVQEELS